MNRESDTNGFCNGTDGVCLYGECYVDVSERYTWFMQRYKWCMVSGKMGYGERYQMVMY